MDILNSQWIEISATVINLIFVVLAARNHIWCWPFGIFGALLAFLTFIDSKLYSDASLQVFYIIMGVYGWRTWNKLSNQDLEVKAEIKIVHIIGICLSIAGSLLLGKFWKSFGGDLPYIDATTTSFSMFATYLQASRFRSNWIYWIVIDFACILIYLHKGLYWFSFLFFIFTVIAIYGYFQWSKKEHTITS